MDERDMLNKVAESAQDIAVPQELCPDQIGRILKKRRQKKRKRYQTIAAAACLCLCFGAGSFAYSRLLLSSRQNETGTDAALKRQEDNQDTAGIYKHAGKDAGDASRINEDAAQAEKEQEQAVLETPVKKLGRMYTLAENYGEVYDVIKKAGLQASAERQEKQAFSFGSAKMEDGSITNSMAEVEDEASVQNDYSSTNLQTEGVDESDIVKTDGRYIYVVQNDNVRVIDVRSGAPKEAAKIVPQMNEDTDRICEMYVADQLLTLLVQTETISLQRKEEDDNSLLDKEEDDGKEEAAKKQMTEDVYADDNFYMDADPAVKVFVYDITDPEKAVLKNKSVQDGWYQTSRKLENRLYVFTNQSLYIADDLQRKRAVTAEAVKKWVPQVDGEAVGTDCIYMQKAGSEGLIMSCIDLADNNKILDTKLLINQYAQLYVTRNSVYLYYEDYVEDVEKTRIARFALDADGRIQAKAAATVKGGIKDTFAVYERGSFLQVLTSITNTDTWENRVYVLDENMETVGKLTGLAEGEMIYSARFTGSIGYFVTYRNTDPLFTVDFSDPADPKVIGELKVTGFSDYLHFWSDDKLLGIGQETDPKSGEVTGLKLSMFDISDPVNVKEEGRIVLKDAEYSEAMYDYKTVLVSPEKNIIALITEKYRDSYRKDYHVYSYQNGRFKSRLDYALAKEGEGRNTGSWRSVYVGSTLYLAGEKKMLAFAMEDQKEWKMTGKVKYAK